MKTRYTLLFALLVVTPAELFAETWDIDPGHSSVNFTIRHLVGRVTGSFTRFEGTLEADQANPTKTKVTASIEAASVDTRNAKRDEHLRSPEFFNVDEHPKLSFKGTKIVSKGEDKYTLTGDFTLLGVTKPVTLDVTFNGLATDPWGNERAGFSATGKLNRKDFGMTYNKLLDRGGAMLGDEVTLTLEIEAVKKKPK